MPLKAKASSRFKEKCLKRIIKKALIAETANRNKKRYTKRMLIFIGVRIQGGKKPNKRSIIFSSNEKCIPDITIK